MGYVRVGIEGYRSTPSVSPIVVVPALVRTCSYSRCRRTIVVWTTMRVRDLILVITLGAEALSTLEVGLGAGSTLQIRIATDGCEVRWPSGKVVRRQLRREIIVVVVPRCE